MAHGIVNLDPQKGDPLHFVASNAGGRDYHQHKKEKVRWQCQKRNDGQSNSAYIKAHRFPHLLPLRKTLHLSLIE